MLGAVAYDPKVVTIWDGFRAWFSGQGLDVDFVLFSNYERQVDALITGAIDVSWNSPLAWVRTVRAVPTARPVAMRDTDRDLLSVVVVRNDGPIGAVEELSGKVLAVGAIDSPQATLIPLGCLSDIACTVRRFDIGVGLHGDHIGGERAAAAALAAGEVDAATMTDANHLAFSKEGLLPPGSTRVLLTTPRYDHCNMSVTTSTSPLIPDVVEALLAMDYADPDVRPLMDLEGLTRWLPGRTTGYAALDDAVTASAFYGPNGEVTADDYHP